MHGGGAFLLTLSVIAGVLLITVPAKATENKPNNVNGVSGAATETIDGQEYSVLNIDQNTTVDAICHFMDENYSNIKFVLQSDIVYTADDANNGVINGLNYVSWLRDSTLAHNLGTETILELNGHSITFDGGLSILASHLTIRDSSPAGTGAIHSNLVGYNRFGNNVTVEIYGGVFDSVTVHNQKESSTANVALRVYGGFINYVGLDPRYIGKGSYLDELGLYGGYVREMDPLITNIKTVDDYAYAVLDVYRDTRASDIESFVRNNEKAKIVFQENWVYNGSSYLFLDGTQCLLDLQGHVVDLAGQSIEGYFTYLELVDSSPTGSGVLQNVSNLQVGYKNGICVVVRSGTYNFIANGIYLITDTKYPQSPMSFYLYGGTVNAARGVVFKPINLKQPATFYMYGGRISGIGISYHHGLSTKTDLTGYQLTTVLAPYVQGKVYDDYYIPPYAQLTEVVRISEPFSAPEIFAVSKSNIVCGIYNFEYNYVPNINSITLKNLVVPNDTIYYLWGRNADGIYEYLNTYYDGSKRTWVAVAPEISVA